MPTPDTLALIDHRLSSIEQGYIELRDAIKDLAAAINKLAIIDERQVQSALVMDKLTTAVDKAHSRVDNLTSEFARAMEAAKVECVTITKELERRVDALEKSDVENRRVRNWAFGLVTLVAVGVLGGLLKMIGLSV